MLLMSAGRLTGELLLAGCVLGDEWLSGWGNVLDAPAINWLLMISTGLNQYSVCGSEQEVTPVPS